MSGLGSSFLVEMNVKKVLDKFGMGDVQVDMRVSMMQRRELQICLSALPISKRNARRQAPPLRWIA